MAASTMLLLRLPVNDRYRRAEDHLVQENYQKIFHDLFSSTFTAIIQAASTTETTIRYVNQFMRSRTFRTHSSCRTAVAAGMTCQQRGRPHRSAGIREPSLFYSSSPLPIALISVSPVKPSALLEHLDRSRILEVPIPLSDGL